MLKLIRIKKWSQYKPDSVTFIEGVHHLSGFGITDKIYLPTLPSVI